ncbi:uncharacterized protein NPIL_90761 [Nephila pilipes]|uniref:Mutator-like transposase domain-containing protein n=1 Tax=Nephila pilipes TaxID=299642 RepID=A0A8X6M7C4_NEPPI|nr:uncharacterized protein NPIL_90761 [Nephila pilipes]
MQKATQEAVLKKGNNKNIAVDVDGTWQKGSYSFLNGVVTVTSTVTLCDTMKVIDVDILSKYCMCSNKVSYKKDCKRNFEVSSGSMEVEGASKIFQRSLTLHDARGKISPDITALALRHYRHPWAVCRTMFLAFRGQIALRTEFNRVCGPTYKSFI